MAKAKKRIAARKKSSKRGNSTPKPARKMAKRTTGKKSAITETWVFGSKVRHVNEKAASDAYAKLEAMSLDERIAAVAADVHSKRDEYRSIESRQLVLLLDIDAYHPDGTWNFVGFVPRVPVRNILLEWNEKFIPELLETHVTAERCEEITAKINLLKRKGTKLRRTSLDFLTEKEKQTSILGGGGGRHWCLGAPYRVSAGHGAGPLVPSTFWPYERSALLSGASRTEDIGPRSPD
jgi:hypothetical protein